MPPTLKDQLRDDITTSLKAGDKLRVSALRMLSAAVTNREKDVLHPLTDDELRAVAGEEVKRRNQAIEAFEGAGRRELADKERAEREVLTAYAPSQLSDQEVAALVDEAIAETGAGSMQDMGAVMGFVMGRAKGRVDGGAVQRMVRERLDS
ncbi:MAG TPA: GatB/YqeY domain-containing protein [Actinomycetota bacterium]|jgi:hypothetical protein